MAISNNVLAKMAVIISAQTAEFNRKMSQSQNSIKKFTGFISSMAGTLGIAFSVQQVAQFALEVSKLAGEAEGVRAAFNKLPQSIKLMDELKRATGGTVSELDLMKRAVQASNFDISLRALPRLLEFAAVRAQQTGQSVDYLVDSIVTGIGRKSKLILDNLGISAVQLDEKLGGVSVAAASVGQVADAVGSIAEENLAKMGSMADTASTKIQRLAASWENLKVKIGEAANSTGVLGSFVQSTTILLDLLADQERTLALADVRRATSGSIFFGDDAAFDKIVELVRKGHEFNETVEQIQSYMGVSAEHAEKIHAFLEKASLKGKELRFSQQDRLIIDPSTGMPAHRQPDSVVPDLSMFQKQIETYDTLKEKLKELNEQFETTATSDKNSLTLLGTQIDDVNKKIAELDKLRKGLTSGGGLIPNIQNEIERFKELQKSAFSPEQVEFYTSKIRELEHRLQMLTREPYDLSIRLDDKGVFGGFLNDVEGRQNKAFSDLDERLNNAMSAFQEDFAKQQKDRTQRFINHTQMMADAAVTMGTTVGDVFGNLATGQIDFLQAMSRVTGQIIEMYLQQSIAAMIAAAIKDPSTPFPLAKVAMAAVGIGLVKSLFSQIGAIGGGGTGAGGSFSALPQHTNGGLKVQITGKISGYDMNLLQDRNAYRRSRVG